MTLSACAAQKSATPPRARAMPKYDTQRRAAMTRAVAAFAYGGWRASRCQHSEICGASPRAICV